MNLMTNASEAIGEETGVITVRTHVVEADRNYLGNTYLHDDLAEGTYVCLEVSDNGEGMDPDTLSNIFDPFFTTKFTGRGLGLAAVLGIVRGHKGALRVNSEAGKGTTFSILFPQEDWDGVITTKSDGEEDSDTDWSGSGTVLVVDDDERVRDSATQILESAGFTVISADNGEEGLAVFRKHADTVEAILLDLTMPEMSGDEAFREIQRIKPGANVILTSGYAETEATSKIETRSLSGFIQKPYRAHALVKTVRDAIQNETVADTKR